MASFVAGPREAILQDSPPPPRGILQVLPREAMSWTTDSFGQVKGASLDAQPLSSAIRSIGPGDGFPPELRCEVRDSSLGIIGTAKGGSVREIASLRWSGPVMTWTTAPVPAASFDQSLKALSGWLSKGTFAAVLESGQTVLVAPAPQLVRMRVDSSGGIIASAPLASVPRGAKLSILPSEASIEEGGAVDDVALAEISRSDLEIRVQLDAQSVLDIVALTGPPQVRAVANTPSRMRLEAVQQRLASTEELISSAPQDQAAILARERAALLAEMRSLRESAVQEKVTPSAKPITALIADPATGREYARIDIDVGPAQKGQPDPAQPGNQRGLQPSQRGGS